MKRSEEAPLTVIARAPFQIYYEGPALMVSAKNAVGNFDILPGHADFFSVLSPGEVIVEPQKTEADNKDKKDPELVTFTINNGIITVRDNEVMVFVNM